MTRTLVTLLLIATVGVVGAFCVIVLDEREQAFRTLLRKEVRRIGDAYSATGDAMPRVSG